MSVDIRSVVDILKNSNINPSTITDPNIFGEYLRDLVFEQNKANKKFGCYSTFELREGFEYVKEVNPAFHLLMGEYPQDMWQEVYSDGRFVTNGEIHAAWFWDGDGTLLVMHGDRAAINYDCKKDYIWEWI